MSGRKRKFTVTHDFLLDVQWYLTAAISCDAKGQRHNFLQYLKPRLKEIDKMLADAGVMSVYYNPALTKRLKTKARVRRFREKLRASK